MVAVVLVSRVPDWWPRAGRIVMLFAGATILAGAAILPVYLPYRRVAKLGLVRSIESVSRVLGDADGISCRRRPDSFLNVEREILDRPRRRILSRIRRDHHGRRGDLLGCAGSASGQLQERADSDNGAATAGAARLSRRRIVMLVAIAATGMILSLGTRTPVYGWVYHVFPPMQGLRAAARFGNLFLLGYGGARRVRPRRSAQPVPTRWAGAIAAGLVIVANIESLRAPLYYTRFDGIPAVYSLLAHEPGRVVLVEVPFYPPQGVFQNGRYVLNSTAHWRPLMNGYSGYTPGAYRQNAATFWLFPAAPRD